MVRHPLITTHNKFFREIKPCGNIVRVYSEVTRSFGAGERGQNKREKNECYTRANSLLHREITEKMDGSYWSV